MTRKLMTVKSSNGQAIRVTVGAKSSNVVTPERIIDPVGLLTVSSPPGRGMSEEQQAAFSEWKRKVQSGEIKRNYP